MAEIFAAVEVSKFSICSSWSGVNVPSRRLNLMSCARAMELASLRALLFSSRTFTSMLSNFLTTRNAFNLFASHSVLQTNQIGLTTLTGL